MESSPVKRQIPSGWVVEDGVAIPWWYSRDGVIFKWCLFLIPLAILLAWFIIGRIHVTRRIKKGLPPLRYHKCLVPQRYRRYPANPWPQQRQYGPADGYYMQNMPPPPVYDPTRLPQYEGPPPVGTKVDPDQSMGGPAAQGQQYQPPPGPPPAVLR
ncbi:hypothetical protein CC79DRAFT_1330857 [Sarocladium strictum]|jgi:hypothetical protein